MNIMMIHGIDSNEDAIPNIYAAWEKAIISGLKCAGYNGEINADPAKNGVNYNSIFPQHPINPIVYAAALDELVAAWAWHMVFGQYKSILTTGVPSDNEGLLDKIRWTIGMVAQWVVEDDLRADCRKLLADAIAKIKPDVIFAHSLGSLICYDLFVNDVSSKNLFAQGTFISLGSQIAFPVIKDKMWGGKVKMINVKKWYHLFNSNDHIFTSPITLDDPNFHQFPITPPFGPHALFDKRAHQVTHGDPNQDDNYPGYLDNDYIVENLWPVLISGSSTASLFQYKIKILESLKSDGLLKFNL